jgi:site-specific DNA recombinase
LIRPTRVAWIIHAIANNGWSWRERSGDKWRDAISLAISPKRGRTMKTAARYARYSSDLQHDRSIDDQLALCQTVATRENLEIKVTYSDRAKSGASMFERDGLIEMMAAAKRREFDCIIVESLDRLSRDQEHMAGMFKRLEFYGIKIVTAHEGVTTPLQVGIRGLTSSLFLTDLGNKVRRGHNGRVRDGKFPGAITYGYRLIPGKPGEREIDQEQAAIVRRIFTEYAAGRSPRTIAADLTRDGVPTCDGRAAPWNHQTFVGGRLKRGMIGNPIYIGEIVWNTCRTVMDPDTGKKTKRAAPAEDRISTAAPHLRIIDQALWNAANQVRQERGVAKFGASGKVQRIHMRASAKDHLLTGILRCGDCGGHMRIANTSRGGGPRVACAAAHQHGPSVCGHSKTYDLDVLQRAVLDGMRRGLTDPAAIVEAARAYQAEYAKGQEKSRTDGAATRKRLDRVQAQIDRLIIAIRDGDLPVKGLMAQAKPLEAERIGLTEQLRLIEAQGNVSLHPAAVDAYGANIQKLHEELAQGLARGGDITPDARAAFRNVMDTIVVHPTGKRMPYEFTPHARLGAIMGVELLPAACSVYGGTAKSVSS